VVATLAAATLGAQAPARQSASIDASGDAPALTAPPLTGPHAVGRRFMVWTDSARRDPDDSTRPRTVALWIWYPAMPAATLTSEPVLDEPWRARRIERLSAKLGPVVARAAGELRVHARADAPLLAGDASFPLLLFTPGLGWLASDYSVTLEDLASHGYVVAGLAPPGFADVVRFPDGREVVRTLGIGEKIGTDQAIVHDDAQFVLRRLRAFVGDRASFLHGRVDLDRVGAFGHSLGGTTALVLAARDSGVRAAVNLDGDPMGDVLAVRPTQPLLLISSESPTIDEAPPGNTAAHLALVRQGLERSETRRTDDWHRIAAGAREATRIRILGARHLNFPDAALGSAWLVTPQERWMRVGPIDGARGLAITAELVRTFFDRTLRGTADETLLRAPERRFPEVRVESDQEGQSR
jgi:dienelactone hydrolase